VFCAQIAGLKGRQAGLLGWAGSDRTVLKQKHPPWFPTSGSKHPCTHQSRTTGPPRHLGRPQPRLSRQRPRCCQSSLPESPEDVGDDVGARVVLPCSMPREAYLLNVVGKEHYPGDAQRTDLTVFLPAITAGRWPILEQLVRSQISRRDGRKALHSLSVAWQSMDDPRQTIVRSTSVLPSEPRSFLPPGTPCERTRGVQTKERQTPS
jgi:hypothetical protein